MPKQRFVYIAGLGHSGSTMLDLFVAGHPECIGLGEVASATVPKTLREHDLLCQCGETKIACPFWGKVTTRLQKMNTEDLKERYEVVFNTFDEVFGPNCNMVDSSKHLHILRFLNENFDLDIKVLHIIRDVRGYTTSSINDVKKKVPNQWGRFVKTRPVRIFFRWYIRNRQIQRFCTENKIDYLKVGYENLCLYPQDTARKICDFLGMEYHEGMTNLKDAQTHTIHGNRMRLQPEKLHIRYDNRWAARREWLWPSLMFPFIMKYNNQSIYVDKGMSVWKR